MANELHFQFIPCWCGVDHQSPVNIAAGQTCPTCGRRVAMTGAERQRKYVAKKKLAEMIAPGRELQEAES